MRSRGESKARLSPKTGIDLEQEQTESTERRLGPEELWYEWHANVLSARSHQLAGRLPALLSITSRTLEAIKIPAEG